MEVKTSVVIPARWKSERLNGKMLADLNGKPVLRHTWERVKKMRYCNELIVATDYDGIYEEVKKWGGKAVMTDEKWKSGTERTASIVDQLEGDFILIVQGDECFINVELLDRLVETWKKDICDIITPICQIKDEEKLMNPNVVKTVIAHDRRALYFSRSPVPYIREKKEVEMTLHWQHIGVYGYKRLVLEKFFDISISPLEEAEKLEQLRFLEAGYTIMTLEEKGTNLDINTLEDLECARKTLMEVTI